MSSCPIISIYGGRRVSDVHRVKFIALIGFPVGAFLFPEVRGKAINKMFKDPGNQSYWWAGIGGFFSLMSAQELLALVSLVIGAITAVVNLVEKYHLRKIKKREEERAEQIHQLKVKRLKQGLNDEQ